jgi:SAM-dependent methyltransferase
VVAVEPGASYADRYRDGDAAGSGRRTRVTAMPPTDDSTPGDDSNPFTSAETYYAEHRPGYSDAVIQYLTDRFELDDSARVLDLGCGTGQIAVPLARFVGEVVGMDPNEEMLREARKRVDATATERENVEWRVGSDSDLSDELGPLRLTTMGRSFHWMAQERTLERLYRMTGSSGGIALLDDVEWFSRGEKAWQDDVYEIASEYVEDLPDRVPETDVEYDDPWDELIAGFGFTDVETETFESIREWTVEGIVGYVFSLSFCSPETFGDDRQAFENDLRARLNERAEDTFVQRVEETVISGKK